MDYGYARVSSKDQNLDRQIDQLLKAGIALENIYCDKKSGKDFDRESYLKLIQKMESDDLLVIVSIDRLGRNYEMIKCEWSRIVNEKKANIKVLDMPLLDTRTANNLIGKFISEVVLEVLSFVSENERDNIRQRQKEGIAIAKVKGIKFGRPETGLDKCYSESYEKYIKREIRLRDVLRKTGLSRNQFFYYLRIYKRNKNN